MHIFGIKCTFNIPSAWIEEPSGSAGHLTPEEIRTLICEKGHEAAVHCAHHTNPKSFEYIKKFIDFDSSKYYLSDHSPKLFYLWGHSYEFDHDNNWDRLEKNCEMLGANNNIWYATNIEIYDYTTAYNSLIYSAVALSVYNTTLKELWLEIDNKTYSIKPNETLHLA